MSVELLQEQVELYLEYAAGSLSRCQNFLGDRLCDFFQVNESRVSARCTELAAPQPVPVPRHRPGTGKEWNGTTNPIHNAAGVVTGYEGVGCFMTGPIGQRVLTYFFN
jgi:hypothetical protein